MVKNKKDSVSDKNVHVATFFNQWKIRRVVPHHGNDNGAWPNNAQISMIASGVEVSNWV